VITANLNDLEVFEVRSQTDPTVHGRYSLPVCSLNGADSTTVYYSEFDPGDRQGRHTNSAEETHLILSGTAEIVTDDEKTSVGQGGVVVIPARVPHDLRNVGSDVLRIAYFLSSAAVVTVFEERFGPEGRNVFVAGQPEET
jgi:quercetin dioxygenase-like cupin family protein